jgi:uncharacterized membrane protein YeaQ/YmgE (transglycosylase-associated protein family)
MKAAATCRSFEVGKSSENSRRIMLKQDCGCGSWNFVSARPWSSAAAPHRKTRAFAAAACYASRREANPDFGRPAGESNMNLDSQSIVIIIVVGVVAGFLAGVIVRGYGLGLVGNLVVGVLGAFLAAWLLPKLGVNINIGSDMVNAILRATIGAVVLLLLVGLVRRST